MAELRLSGGELYIPSAEIADRTQRLANYYDGLYGENEVAVLTVLNGASHFAHNLTRAMRNPLVLEDTVRVKSMSGDESVDPTLIKEPDIHIKGMDVLVVEDIDDTRKTLNFLLPRLRDQRPRSLSLVSLLIKPEKEKVTDELDADDVQYGFSIVNEFVVGHGLDWNDPETEKQYYRSLGHITTAFNRNGPGQKKFFVPTVPREPSITPVPIQTAQWQWAAAGS